jgi:WXG100 family type VII secretion target
MAASTVRADYDQLSQVASAFRQNVAAAQRTLQNIKSSLDTLQGGDWIGVGATAFYQEMNNSVLPTWQRLISALDTAATSTAQISAIMKDAEDQAANVLKGPGGSSGPIGPGATGGAGLGGAMAGMAGAGAAGPMGASSSLGAASAAGSSASTVSFDGKPIHKAQAEAAMAGGNAIGPDALTVKQKIIEPGVGGSQATSSTLGANNIGFSQADAGSKDAAGINIKGGLANEGWERDNVKLNQVAGSGVGLPEADAGSKDAGMMQGIKGNMFNQSAQNLAGANTIGGAASEDWIKGNTFNQSAQNLAGANTIGGAASEDWIKASGAAGPKISADTVSGQRQHDPINFKVGGDLGSTSKLDQAAASNTIGGAASDDWIKASGAPAQKINVNTVGGKAAADDWSQQTGANTIGGAASQDDWTQTGGGAPASSGNAGGGTFKDNWPGVGGGQTFKDGWQGTGGAPAGGSSGSGQTFKDGWQGTGGGAPAGSGQTFKDGWQGTGGASAGGGQTFKDGWQGTGGANTIGGAAADDWLNTGAAPAPGTPSAPVETTRVNQTFNPIDINNVQGNTAATDNWSQGSGTPPDDHDKDD